MAPVPWATTAYSALLLTAALVRPSLLSLLYLMLFLTAVIAPPHPFLPHNNTIGKVLVIVSFALSGVALLAQLVFQLIVHLEPAIAAKYISGSFSYDLLALIGFRPSVRCRGIHSCGSVDSDWLTALQHLAPEPLVLAAAILLLVMWKRYRLFQSAKFHLRRAPHGQSATEHDPEELLDPGIRDIGPSFVEAAGYINAALLIFTIGSASFSSLSVTSVPYFILLVCIFAAISMRYSGEKLLDWTSPILAIYSVLHLILFYTYQLPFVSARLSSTLVHVLGLQTLFAFPFIFDSWTRFAGSVILLSSLVAIVFLVTFRMFARTVYNTFCSLEKSPAGPALGRLFPQHVPPPLELKDVVSAAQRPARRPSTLRWLLSFAAMHLWKVAAIAAFCLCITFPRLLYLPLLVATFMAFIGPSGKEPPKPPPSGDDELDHLDWLELKDKLVQRESLFRRQFRTVVLRYTLFYALLLLTAQYACNLQSTAPVKPSDVTNNLGLTDENVLNSNVIIAWLAVVCLLLSGWLHLRPADEDRAAVEALHKEMRQSGYNSSGPRPAPLLKDYVWVMMMLFFRSSYALALIGLYICSLLSVDVLSAGYLAFFLLFFLYESLASRFWWALILYTECVIVLQFVWQVTWTRQMENNVTRLIGLEHFASNWEGFVWSVVILLFTLLQQNLSHNLDQGFILVPDKVLNIRRAVLLQRVSQLDWLPDWLRHFKDFIVDHFETACLFGTYLALLMVAIMTRIGVISVTYLVFLFVCLGIHLGSQSPRRYVRAGWPFVVFFSAITLVVRYVYQFPGVGNEVQKHWLPTSLVTPADFDLELYDSHSLFVGLLPNTAVLLLAIITWNRFKASDLEMKRGKQIGTSALIDKQEGVARDLIAFGRRLLILHASKVTFFVIFGACAAAPSMLNLVYLLVLIGTVSVPRGTDHVGLLVFLWTCVVVLVQNLFRFSYWYDTDWTRWVGLIDTRPYHEVVGWNAALLVCLQVQRVAARWKVLDYGGAAYQDIALLPLSDVEELKAELVALHDKPRRKALVLLRERTKWYLSNMYSISGLAIFIVVLLVAIFIRNNVLAVAYLPILGISLLLSDRNLKSALLFLCVFLGAVLVIQYVALFDFPPVLASLNWPWVNLVARHPTLGRYLALCCYSPWELFADFLLVFCTARLDFRSGAAEEQLLRLNAVLDDEANRDGASWFEQSRSVIFLYSYKVSLVLIFMLGTARPSFLTLGYVAISLFFLFRGDYLIRQRNLAWRWARLWNFGVLIFKAIFQAAFIPAGNSAGSWQAAFGLHKMTVTNAYADKGVLFDIAIFLLMAMQAKIFDHPSFEDIGQEWQLEQRVALRRSKTELLEFLEKQRQEKELIEAKKAQRAHRVEELLAHASAAEPMPLRKVTLLPAVIPVLPLQAEETQTAAPVSEADKTPKSALAKFRATLLAISEWIEDHLLRPDGTPEGEPRKGLILAFLAWVRAHSVELIFLAFVINMTANADAISAFYPITFEFPRPAKAYWQITLAYCLLALVAKFLFQIPVFCICNCASYHVQPYCENLATCGDCGAADRFFQLPRMVGLYKYRASFLPSILPDFLCLLCLLFHRHMLKSKGLWLTETQAKRIKKEALAKNKLKKQPKAPQATHREPTDVLPALAPEPEKAESPGASKLPEKDEIEPISVPNRDTDPLLPLQFPSAVLTPSTPRSWYERLWGQVLKYYVLHKDRLSPRSDYYTAMVVCQGLQFIITAGLPQPFIGVRDANVAEFWTNSRIPLNYFLILLVQFLLIILDRVIYLFKATLLKIALQYAMIGSTTALYFWVWPIAIQTPFTHSVVLIMSYLLMCLYLYLSALQIQAGYPYEMDEHYLTRTYREPRPTLFNLYRAIPFAYELRTLLDWITTDTSLGWNAWLKIEDIYAELYNVKCRLEGFRNNPDRRIGTPQPRSAKFLTGVLLFVGLCLVIFFPLLIVSAANPTNQSNPVTQLTVDITVKGWDPLFHVSEPSSVFQQSLDSNTFSNIRSRFGTLEADDRRNLQYVKLQNYSSTVWSISPPSFSSLIDFLQLNQSVEMQVTLTFLRQYPAGAPPLSFVSPAPISTTAAAQLAQSIRVSNPNTPILIPALIPRLLELPASGSIGTSQSIKETVTVLLSAATGKGQEGQPVDYFTLTQNVSTKESIFTSLSNVEFLVWSAPQNSALAGAIASADVTFVLALGRFLRQSVTGLSHTIMFSELPECDKLLAVCEDLYLARKAGQLGLEELMYHELIDLYRSPERLKEETALPPGKRWGGTGLPPQDLIDNMRQEITASKKND